MSIHPYFWLSMPLNEELARRARESVRRGQREQKIEQDRRKDELAKRVDEIIPIVGADREDQTAVRHIKQSIRFVQGMAALIENPNPIIDDKLDDNGMLALDADGLPVQAQVRPRSKEEKKASKRVAQILRKLELNAEKQAAKRMASALRKLELEWKKPHLEQFVRDYFPMLRTEIRQWREHCEYRAKIRLPLGKRNDAAVRHIAVGEAKSLLKQLIPGGKSLDAALLVKQLKQLKLTSGSKKFAKLTAALLGDPGARLNHVVRD